MMSHVSPSTPSNTAELQRVGRVRPRLGHVRHAVAELEAAAAEIRASGPWRAQCLPLQILDGERRSEENDEEGRGAHG